MKHLISGSMALLLLGAMLASCGAEGTPEKSSDTAAAETTPIAPVETDIYDLVAKPDLNGYAFRICNTNSNFAYQKLSVEKETGEALDDAVYRRNSETESALNITISVDNMEYNEVIAKIKNNVAAGDHVYDYYYDESGQLQANGIFGGYCADMKSVSTINYDQPWWNEKAMESVEIGNERYFLYNDINVMFYECYAAYFVNRTMASDLDLPDFYQMVDDGKWTFDMLKECVLAASADLNGDGKYDENDRFGCVFYDSCNPGYFIAGGTHLISRNADGIPEWNGATQKMTDIYDKICDCLFRNKDAIRTAGSAGLSVQNQHTFFHNGQSLFFYEPIGSLKKFRDVDFQVGILPFPKYDEKQAEYGSFICYIAPAGVVPVTCPDTEKTGSIIEVMAAYSNKYVRPAYFDTTLQFKYAQDQNSQKMLDLILQTGEFDLADLYDWGGIRQKVRSLLSAGSTNWTSNMEAITGRVSSAIEALVNAGN